ncbi:MAG TPA: hypothetical protein VFX95_02410, partial [Caulobacteraceae bacterium]|nr:hypothetical protein [Caulobacteraceae bacterium]
GDGQLPYMTMNRVRRHGDAAIAQQWISYHDETAKPVGRMVARSGLSGADPRFGAAAGALQLPPAGRGTMSRGQPRGGA